MAADRIHIDWPRIGDVLYFTIETDSDEIWNGSTLTTFVVANFGTYDVEMEETPASSAHYVGPFPELAAGFYIVRIRYRVGGAPAVTDPVVGTDLFYWTGTAIERGANVTRLDGDSTALANQRRVARTFVSGAVATAVGSANTATAFDTNLTQEADNYYGTVTGGAVLAFINTANNKHETRRVVASTSVGANTRVTMDEAFDATPTVADEFVIGGRR